MSPVQIASRNITDPLVTFEICQDMPGSLSVEGPCHDNDHKNITDIKIMPNTQEIQSHRLEYLPFRDPGACPVSHQSLRDNEDLSLTRPKQQRSTPNY